MRLTDTHKEHIIKRFAQFYDAPAIRDELRDKFGVQAELNQIYTYDPSSSKSVNLAKKWRKLHADERKKFVSADDDASIQEMQKSVLCYASQRIRELEDNYRTLKAAGNLREANATLEQIAKEQGQMYTNRALIEAQIEKERDEQGTRKSTYTQINNFFNLSPGEGASDSRAIEAAIRQDDDDDEGQQDGSTSP